MVLVQELRDCDWPVVDRFLGGCERREHQQCEREGELVADSPPIANFQLRSLLIHLYP